MYRTSVQRSRYLLPRVSYAHQTTST